MNRRDRRRHGKRDDYTKIQTIEMTPTHVEVLAALVTATKNEDGLVHESQIADALGMDVEDVGRILHELTFWGLVKEAR